MKIEGLWNENLHLHYFTFSPSAMCRMTNIFLSKSGSLSYTEYVIKPGLPDWLFLQLILGLEIKINKIC